MIIIEYNLPCITQHTFQNPVQYIDRKQHTNPDPHVIKWCGKYYCYSSGEQGVRVSVSEDLTLWEYQGYAISEPSNQNYWAPSVLYRNGLFYMYYSNELAGEKELHREFLKLAVSDAPLGPFIYQKTFFDKFSIDAHPVEWGSEVYLFYSTNDITGNADEYAGTCILVDRLVTMDTFAGSPAVVVTPSLSEEIFAKNRFGDGRDWYTIEGACFVEKHDKCYLLYSANAYVTETYFVGYAVADKKANFLDMQWEKYPDMNTFHPLLRRNSVVEGTGHNTVVKAPNLVDDWIIYHGRDASVPIIDGTEQRVMRMDPLFCDGECMITNGPSSEYQDAPRLPELKIEYQQSQNPWLECDTNDCYIAEASIKPQSNSDGARYGVLLNYCDAGNYVEAQFQSGRNDVKIMTKDHGLEYELIAMALPKDYNHFVVHRVEIRKQYNRYILAIDSVYKIHFHISMPNGKLGFVPHYTTLEIFGFSKNDHCALWRRELLDLKHIYKIEPNAILDERGIMPGSCKSITLQREEFTTSAYVEEFTVEALSSDSEFSLVAFCENGNEYERCKIANKKGSFTVRTMQNGSKGWMLADGNANHFSVENIHIKNVQIKLKNMRIIGYLHTNMAQKCNVKSKNV